MNPAFIILVLLGAVIVWFLLSFVFVPLGSAIHKVGKNAMDEMNKDETETKTDTETDVIVVKEEITETTETTEKKEEVD